MVDLRRIERAGIGGKGKRPQPKPRDKALHPSTVAGMHIEWRRGVASIGSTKVHRRLRRMRATGERKQRTAIISTSRRRCLIVNSGGRFSFSADQGREAGCPAPPSQIPAWRNTVAVSSVDAQPVAASATPLLGFLVGLDHAVPGFWRNTGVNDSFNTRAGDRFQPGPICRSPFYPSQRDRVPEPGVARGTSYPGKPAPGIPTPKVLRRVAGRSDLPGRNLVEVVFQNRINPG